MMFAGVYYSTQRLCKCRTASDKLSAIHFWGWQLIIVSAAITLPLGITQSKEYAELEWPIDIAIAVVWVFFGINFLMTLVNRRERHLYVALWFYIATIVTVAILHIFNNLALPVNLFKSYPIYAGVQDAFMQWWYGHNAVAFFLTTPFLGLMYYFLPKAAEAAGVLLPAVDPALLVAGLHLYLGWSAPPALHRAARVGLDAGHDLLGDAVDAVVGRHDQRPAHAARRVAQGRRGPGAQVLRRRHHLLRHVHLRGPAALDQERQRPVALHRLDHRPRARRGPGLERLHDLRHGLLAAPRLFQTKLCTARSSPTWHFWIGTIGILLYIVPIYAAGITQGLMWRAFDETGRLQYPDFVETVTRLMPMYWVRALGGTMYLAGTLLAATTSS